jgi:hypothetical protein
MTAAETGRRTMTMKRVLSQICAVGLLALAVLSAGVTAQKVDTGVARAAALPERIWQDPGDAALLDLTYGAGGKAHAPDPAGTFTFVSEDLGGSNPKFVVTDGQGVEWKVKLGHESQSETAATRFLWAAGYFVDQDYYMAELTVKGMPTLQRGRDLVSPTGTVEGARLERKPKSVKKLGDWDWFANPFTGTRELNGLRVMMSMVNNWDLKQVNNSIYAVNGERRYVVSDAGATFGHTGNALQRSRSVPKDYESSTFIAKLHPGVVDFELNSRPMFLYAVAVSNYRERAKMEKITQDIPRADAKWLGRRLAALTDSQIRDGFRSAGYGPADVEILTRAIRKRIAALEAL